MTSKHGAHQHHADDVVDIIIVHGDPRVAAFRNGAHECADIGRGLHSDDLDARFHDGGDQGVLGT